MNIRYETDSQGCVSMEPIPISESTGDEFQAAVEGRLIEG